MSEAFCLTAPLCIDPDSLRKMIEELADLCVLLLDQLDGDADFEPDSDDEPSLGSLDQRDSQGGWAGGMDGDRELDTSDYEDGGDTEDNGDEHDLNGDEHDADHQHEDTFLMIGAGSRFLPADAQAVDRARRRLGAIMDRVGGRP